MITKDSKISDIIRHWCVVENLPEDLLCAVIWHESVSACVGSTPKDTINRAIYAVRPEPGFYGMYLRNRPYATLAGYKPAGIPNATAEKLLRSQSYGLTQIMGETARVLGFRGQFLTELFQPYCNIKFGAMYLGKHYRQGGVDHALLRYNGGGNKKYPDLVNTVRRSGEWKILLDF